MNTINIDILKQLSDFADWILKLPETLIDSVMAPREVYFTRKERIAKLKELVELRELAKTLTGIYVFKGSMVQWVKILQKERRPEDAKELRRLLVGVASGIRNMSDVLSETSISGFAVGAEAALQLGRAATIYDSLAAYSDEILLNDDRLIMVADELERMIEVAKPLLDRIDTHRALLDHTYG
jgi:hypothetical protein